MVNFFRAGKKHVAFNVVMLGILFFTANYILTLLFHLQSGYIIWSDAEGYYEYLPFYFIFHDITHICYAVPVAGGMTFDKYPCGVALLEMPFFLVAHLYNQIFGFIDDGVTSVYGMSIWIAAVFYVYAGLVMLFNILRKWFSRWASFITVLVLFYGTNLFYYTLFNPGYAHAYGFFVLVLFVYGLDKFLKKPTVGNTIICGLGIGLAVLIRPTNVFYVFLFLLYDVYTFKSLKERVVWIFKKTWYFLLIALITFIVFIPQMLYWHAVLGQYVAYSYDYSQGGSESFIYWNSPKIGYTLFGVESGWLVYSPVFFLFFAGLVWTLIKRIHHSFAILTLFILILYANASWWCYTFSCSFGQRALIEYYPVFIIPVAFIIQKALGAKRKVALIILAFFLTIFSFLNLRMSEFYYVEQCWVRPDWTWVNYNRVLNKAFYIIPQERDIK